MNGRPIIIGLLGGIASGKSTVAALFGALGAAVLDADRIAHEVLSDPTIAPGLQGIVGPEALDAKGRPDRKAIGKAVFADPGKLGRLEALIHPPVRERMERGIREAGIVEAVVLDAPLLLEGGLLSLADEVVYVESPADVRRRRASEDRGWTAGELDTREARQAPLAEKRSRAGHTIVNDGTMDALRAKVAEVYRSILDARARRAVADGQGKTD